MVKNIQKIAAVALLATIVGSASARVNFGFSFGTSAYCPIVAPAPVVYRPARVVYAPAPVVYRSEPVVYTAPRVGFQVGTPGFGFGIDFPVHTSKKRDNCGKSYWRIYNDTNTVVTCVNACGEQISIMPGGNATLNHKNSFKFAVYANGRKINMRSENHTLSVDMNRFGKLQVFAA